MKVASETAVDETDERNVVTGNRGPWMESHEPQHLEAREKRSLRDSLEEQTVTERTVRVCCGRACVQTEG